MGPTEHSPCPPADPEDVSGNENSESLASSTPGHLSFCPLSPSGHRTTFSIAGQKAEHGAKVTALGEEAQGQRTQQFLEACDPCPQLMGLRREHHLSLLPAGTATHSATRLNFPPCHSPASQYRLGPNPSSFLWPLRFSGMWPRPCLHPEPFPSQPYPTQPCLRASVHAVLFAWNAFPRAGSLSSFSPQLNRPHSLLC